MVEVIQHHNTIQKWIIPVILIIITIQNTDSTGLNIWDHGYTDFNAGSRSNTEIVDNEIVLGHNASLLGNWTKMVDGWPAPRISPSFGYDTTKDKIFLFSGEKPMIGQYCDTWIYDVEQDTWTEVAPATGSSSGPGGGMITFARNDGVFVLCIHDDCNEMDTWTYNLTTNTWKNQNPSPAPPQMFYPAMTYDTDRGLVLLFGGSDLWSYNVSANSWSSHPRPSTMPEDKESAMAYESAIQKTVIISRNELWWYNASNNQWANKTPSNFPQYINWIKMVYDENSKLLVVNGHSSTDPGPWLYNASSNDWHNMGSAPKEMADADYGMTFDSKDGLIVIFGGVKGNGDYCDGSVWFYNSSSDSWSRRTATNTPIGIQHFGFAYDSSHGSAILFGGRVGCYGSGLNPGPCVNETWEYSLITNQWTKRQVKDAPPARYGCRLVYDSRNGVFVLFGGNGINGSLNDTWIFNPSKNIWNRTNPPTSPPARFDFAMTYDTTEDVVILFGGAYSKWNGSWVDRLNDTWIYNIKRDVWSEASPNLSPPPRKRHDMAYDVEHGVNILFGGFASSEPNGGCELLNDTWAYNSSANCWTRLDCAVFPTERDEHALAYNLHDGTVMLFGGNDWSAETPLDDMWTFDFDTKNWSQVYLPEIPSRRCGHAMAYDSANEAIILVGGLASFTWAYGCNGYFRSGSYLSPGYDTGGPSYFGPISWISNTSTNTAVKLKVRSANTSNDLDAQPFLGPDGTSDSWYIYPGGGIYFGHNGHRFVQFRVQLITKNPMETPSLKSVKLVYNRMQNLTLLTPTGKEMLRGIQNISWMASDPDNDTLSFNVSLLDGGIRRSLKSNIPPDVFNCTWNTELVPDGKYRIVVSSSDNNPVVPVTVENISEEFIVYNNDPPSAELLAPVDGEIFNRTNIILTWIGTDPEHDPIISYIHISTSTFYSTSPPAPVATTDKESFIANNLTDGEDYFWTVTPNDGKCNGTAPPVRKFSIHLPVPNHPPAVDLLSPPNNSVVISIPVRFSWHGSDPDGDSLAYIFRIGTLPGRMGSHFMTSNESFNLDDFSANQTYYWTVSVTDNISTESPITSELWSFTIRFPPANIPVRITSTPPEIAWTGQVYVYNVTTIDEDNDFPAFRLILGPPNMTLEDSTGQLRWTPGSSDIGNHSITVQVSDGRGSFANQTFSLRVLETSIPLIPPTCKITSPVNGSKISGRIQIRGTVIIGRLPIESVFVRIDGSDWKLATGLENWNLNIETSKLKNGQHIIEARAFDSSLYSETGSVTVSVVNPEPSVLLVTNPFCLPAIILAVLAGLGILIILRKKKGRPPDR